MDQVTIEDTIQKTVRETLFQIGILVDTPEDVVQFREDMMHLRKWRKTVENIENKSWTTIAGILVSGVLAAIVLAAQSFFNHH